MEAKRRTRKPDPARRKAYYHKRVDSGSCFGCPNKATPGRTTCEPCRERKRLERVAVYAMRKASGLCSGCGEQEVQPRTQCDSCRRRSRAAQKKRKLAVLAGYGGKCECCGESESMFLAIDHIEGGGRQHLKSLGVGGGVFYKWLRKNKFPPGFRVLCHNCNMGRHLNGGICPHKLQENK